MPNTLRQEIIDFCCKKDKGGKIILRTRQEIMEKFNIPFSKRETLRKRLIENNIQVLDTRGRKKIAI